MLHVVSHVPVFIIFEKYVLQSDVHLRCAACAPSQWTHNEALWLTYRHCNEFLLHFI